MQIYRENTRKLKDVKEPLNIFKYLKLKWEKNCMNFHKSKRPVKTASDVQIRKPMNKGSINSWINYEPYLSNRFKKLYK